MCGITAIVSTNGAPVSRPQLEAATRIAAHRGRDGEGFYVEGNIGLGHRRLAVFDLSEQGKQPMAYQNSVISFNGAIYNYPELRQQLQKKGLIFQTKTDTEVILAAYACWGIDCLRHFNGMWAFTLYDAEKQTLFAARDRFGIKPLYYSKVGNQFCLASEIKQFTVLEAWQARPNKARCYEFLAHGWQNHTNETLFEGVFQLPGGYWLLYDLRTHEYRIQSYYSLENEIPPYRQPFSKAKKQFRGLLEDSIRLRLRSDVPLGITLSGGIDSSSIALLSNSLFKTSNGQNASLSSISVCFDQPRIDERPFVNAVLEKTGILNYQVFPSFSKLEELLKKVIWHQDEPIASASIFAQYLAFEEAQKRGLKVMLGGQGADEILGGYDACLAPFLKSLVRADPLWASWEAMAMIYFNRQTFRNRFWQAVHSPPKFPLYALKSEFRPNKETLFIPKGAHGLKELGIQLTNHNPLPSLLHYEDRNSMAFAVESRVPFLDHRLVEFCLSLPDRYKIRNGKRKYILREALKAEFPGLIYRRYDKLAFATPQEDWVEENASFFRRSQVNTPVIEEYIEKNLPEKKSSNFSLIWRIKAFTCWHEIFFRQAQ